MRDEQKIRALEATLNFYRTKELVQMENELELDEFVLQVSLILAQITGLEVTNDPENPLEYLLRGRTYITLPDWMAGSSAKDLSGRFSLQLKSKLKYFHGDLVSIRITKTDSNYDLVDKKMLTKQGKKVLTCDTFHLVAMLKSSKGILGEVQAMCNLYVWKFVGTVFAGIDAYIFIENSEDLKKILRKSRLKSQIKASDVEAEAASKPLPGSFESPKN